MSAKNLTRPGSPLPSADALGELFGLPTREATLRQLSLSRIDVRAGFNPRTAHLSPQAFEATLSREALKDLSSSMAEVLEDGKPRGVQQPLLVRPTTGERFELVAGERRFHAARYAGLEQVPVLVRVLSDRETLAAAIIENAQRKTLDVVAETYSGFAFLTQITGLEQPALISHLNALRQGTVDDTFDLEHKLRVLYGTGVSTWGQQRARILRLSEAEQQAVRLNRLEVKAAFELLRLPDPQVREDLLHQLLAQAQKLDRETVRVRVDAHLQKNTPLVAQHAQSLSKLAGRVGKLTGEEAREAQRLIKALQDLVFRSK